MTDTKRVPRLFPANNKGLQLSYFTAKLGDGWYVVHRIDTGCEALWLCEPVEPHQAFKWALKSAFMATWRWGR